MKKCLLSAAVLGLLVPAIYAMDGAAEPAVEVEVPTVETQVEVEVTVAAEEVPATDDLKVEVDSGDAPAFSDHEMIIVDRDGVAVCEPAPDFVVCPHVVEGEVEVTSVDTCEKDDGSCEPVHPIFYSFGAPGAVDDSAPVDGGTVDPNAVDLASQSGIALEARGGDGEIQPNYRTLNDGNEPVHVMYFGALAGGDAPAATPSSLAEPQLLNDEQRGAVRGLRSEAEEPAKPHTGLGKFMAKFRKPKSNVTQASATTTVKTDKALAGKLAEVDRMRDTALRTGDQKALAKADKLEKELRAKAGTATRIPTRTK